MVQMYAATAVGSMQAGPGRSAGCREILGQRRAYRICPAILSATHSVDFLISWRARCA